MVIILRNSQKGARVESFSFLYANCSNKSENICNIPVDINNIKIQKFGIWKSKKIYQKIANKSINTAHKN
ncbi:MAG: hypothetical protein ACPHY8_05115 [Patescibacteria group bacterium]